MSDDEATIQDSYPWITNDFFLKIVQSVEQSAEEISITSFTVAAALAKGQNYGSNMLRAIVTYTHRNRTVTLPLIIKCGIVANAELGKYYTELGLFRKEINIYRNVLPEVEKRLRSIGDQTKLAPK